MERISDGATERRASLISEGCAGLLSPGESCGGAARKEQDAAKSHLINGSLFWSSACAWTVIENMLSINTRLGIFHVTGEPIWLGSPVGVGLVSETAAMVHADYIEIQDSLTFCS